MIPRCATPAFAVALVLAIVAGTVVAAVGNDTAALAAVVVVTALPVLYLRRKARQGASSPIR